MFANADSRMSRKTMNINHDRIAWVDALKFLGIWAIYIGHFGSKAGKVYPFVFTYHVPMFFFAAGFFATRYLKDTPLTFIKKKTLQLMLPYAFFSLMALAVFTLQNSWEFSEIKNAFISSLFGIRNQVFAGSLWFIPCLYIMVVSDYFIRRLFKSQILVLVIAIGAFIASQTLLPNNPALKPSWFMNLDSALYFYAYYVLGAILFPLIAKDPKDTTQKILAATLTVASSIVTVITFILGSQWFFGKITSVLPAISAFQLISAFFNMSIALVIIYFNVVIAKLFAHVPVLGELGRETLIFCGTEDITKNILSQLLAMINLKLRLITPLITVLFALICLLVSKYTLVRFFNTYFPWAVGKASLPARVKSDLPTG